MFVVAAALPRRRGRVIATITGEQRQHALGEDNALPNGTTLHANPGGDNHPVGGGVSGSNNLMLSPFDAEPTSRQSHGTESTQHSASRSYG